MLAVARIARASQWSRFRSWLRAKLHCCRDCRVLSTDEGVGGQCVECGRIYGWMTRDEMRRAIMMPHIVPVRLPDRKFLWHREAPTMPTPGDGAPRS